MTGTRIVLEKSSPVKTTSLGPIQLREFASPSREKLVPPEDLFASLDESSLHFHVENTLGRRQIQKKQFRHHKKQFFGLKKVS